MNNMRLGDARDADRDAIQSVPLSAFEQCASQMKEILLRIRFIK